MASGDLALIRGRDRADHIELLAAAAGGRVGLSGVLADLDRRAWRVPRGALGPLRGLDAVTAAYAWGWREQVDRRWWPQGMSADPAGGRRWVTTAYAKTGGAGGHGARITVIGADDRGRWRYRHVLLVEVTPAADGSLGLQPVHIHAGGVAWVGDHLHIAATRKGLYTFRLPDLLPARSRAGGLGLHRDGVSAFGFGYVLPVHRLYAASRPDFRYSFVSVSVDDTTPTLVAGEYHRDRAGRLARVALDGAGLPEADNEGQVAVHHLGEGVRRMQGAVIVRGRLHVTTSAGRRGRGTLWGGRTDSAQPGSLQRVASLPPGVEDLTAGAQDGVLWTVTEYPGRRLIVAVRQPAD